MITTSTPLKMSAHAYILVPTPYGNVPPLHFDLLNFLLHWKV
jgi:hypothetical protein